MWLIRTGKGWESYAQDKRLLSFTTGLIISLTFSSHVDYSPWTHGRTFQSWIFIIVIVSGVVFVSPLKSEVINNVVFHTFQLIHFPLNVFQYLFVGSYDGFFSLGVPILVLFLQILKYKYGEAEERITFIAPTRSAFHPCLTLSVLREIQDSDKLNKVIAKSRTLIITSTSRLLLGPNMQETRNSSHESTW